LALILIIWATIDFRWRWTKWLLLPSLFMHSAALLLAQNRASIIATGLVLGGLVLWQASFAWKWILLTVASFVGVAYVTFDPGFQLISQAGGGVASFLSRDQSVQELTAFSGREEMWSAIWDSFLRAPWFGHGYFVSSEAGEIKVWYLWANWTAHNFWLQVLVGTGIIGAAMLAWALLSYAFRLLRSRHKGVALHRFVVLGIAILLWQIMWGLTNESFVGPLQAESIVFFTVLGVIMSRMAHGAAAEVLCSRGVPRFNPGRPAVSASTV